MTLPSKVIVIIPAFNEEKTVGSVVENLKPYCNEVIVVDDCSGDGTKNKAQEAGAFMVSHSKNQGYDASIEDGFKEAVKQGADILVTFDADGQHNPEEVKKLTNLILNRKADVVIGQRAKVTHFGEKIFSWYTSAFFGIRDPLCGLKAYDKKVYEKIGHFDTIQSIGTQLMVEAAKSGFKIEKVQININDRKDISRFYFHAVRANYKILKALIKLVFLKKEGRMKRT